MRNNIYVEEGYENREAYLLALADDYGIDEVTVFTLADMLGPDEDFDGLISELEDIVSLNY